MSRASGGMNGATGPQDMVFRVESVLTGSVRAFATGEVSAIEKTAVEGSRAVHWLGIEGDAQADLSVHGGPDKAIHHYPFDHYAHWRTALGALPVLKQAGAFGENISTLGLTEDVACIGDRYQLGSAVVEIAQGRQPCWKQAHRLASRNMVAAMVKSRRCGWYYRVIEEGVVAAGDSLTLLDRPHLEWNVRRVIGLLIAGEGRTEKDAVRALAEMPVLAENWRLRAVHILSL
jgi:MOSC domain-containing protein YiiM